MSVTSLMAMHDLKGNSRFRNAPRLDGYIGLRARRCTAPEEFAFNIESSVGGKDVLALRGFT